MAERRSGLATGNMVVWNMHSPIRAILLLVLIALPLLEIALLIKIGQLIGFWATILLVVGTAVLGSSLLHYQGIGTLRRVMASVDEGKPPVAPVLDGFLLLLAGVLLIMPGVITDLVGLILLIPIVRKLVVKFGLSRLLIVTVGGRPWSDEKESGAGRQTAGKWSSSQQESNWQSGSRKNERPAGEGPIIEGEFERLEERSVDPRRDKS